MYYAWNVSIFWPSWAGREREHIVWVTLSKREEQLELNMKALFAIILSICETDLKDKICYSENIHGKLDSLELLNIKQLM